MEGVIADVYEWRSAYGYWEWVSYDETDAGGAYLGEGLDTANYHVEFTDSLGQVVAETYDQQPDLDSGTDVAESLGETTYGVDAWLALVPMTTTWPLVGDCNLVSLSLSSIETDPETALATITGTYRTLWAYDGCDADDPPGPELALDDLVAWTYVVTNTGNVALTDVAVTDDLEGAITCPWGVTLAPGASMTCAAAGTAQSGQYSNLGTVAGTPPGGLEAVTDKDRSHYRVEGGRIFVPVVFR